MNTKAAVSILFLLTLALPSCGSSKPSCDSNDTIDTVLSLLKRRGGEGTSQLLQKGAKMEIRNAKTVKIESDGSCLCEAGLYVDVSAIEPKKHERETKATIPFQYKVYLAPNGKDIRYEILD